MFLFLKFDFNLIVILLIFFFQISLCSFYCIFILSAKLTNINAETSGIYERNEIIENDRGESLYPYDLRSYSNSVECRRPATCVKLEYNTCMGTVLPYTMSTLDLLPEGTTQDLIAVINYQISSSQYLLTTTRVEFKDINYFNFSLVISIF